MKPNPWVRPSESCPPCGLTGSSPPSAIRRLQRQGLADRSLDPTIVAPALTAMVTRFAEMWFVQGQVDCTFDEGVEQLGILCMNALQVKDKVETPRRRRLKAT